MMIPLTTNTSINDKPIFTTVCQNCTFAKYQEGLDGRKAQVECELGRLYIYDKQGKAYIEGNNDFYTINTFCSACRDKNSVWDDYGKINLKDKIDKINKEIEIKISLVIVSESGNFQEIDTTISSAYNQIGTKFKNIFVIIPSKNNNSNKTCLDILRKYKTGIKVLNTFTDYDYGLYVDEAVEQIGLKESMFYTACKAGIILPEELNFEINELVTKYLVSFFYLYSSNFEVVHNRMHKTVGGNQKATHEMDNGAIINCDSVKSKIEMVCKDSSQDGMILKWT